MIAAIKWVRDNIAAFGGDPGNITLFGESAGAWAIAALITSPLAEGLFQRAICQSGHALLSRDIPLMQRLVRRLAKRLKIAPDHRGFTSLASEKLLSAQAWVMLPSLWFNMRDAGHHDYTFGITRFTPVHGDDVLPVSPIEALRQGAGKHIKLLIGTTSDEANLFIVPGNLTSKLKRWMAVMFLRKGMPEARAALRAYGINEVGARPGDVLSKAMTDLVFRWMARRTAELHCGESHVYEFDWRSPAMDGKLGAAHGMELPFVFDTLHAASGKRGLLGECPPPQKLADSMHALWVGFGTDGSLPWPKYEPETRMVYSLTRNDVGHEPVMPAAAFLP